MELIELIAFVLLNSFVYLEFQLSIKYINSVEF